MSFKIEGTLKVKGDTTQVSEKFTKREFVLTDSSGMYPQDIQFQLSQDKCSLLDNAQIGAALSVSFNLRGREWTNPQGETKYFNTLDAWKIELAAQPAQQNQPQTSAQTTSNTSNNGDDDDLPF